MLPVSTPIMESVVATATTVAFKDVLGSVDPSLFVQLSDDLWGGLFVDVLDDTEVPYRPVLKGVETRSQSVRTNIFC